MDVSNDRGARLTLRDGRRSGELLGSKVFMREKVANDYLYQIGLPQGNYDVAVTGTAIGGFEVMTRGRGQTSTYAASIETGNTAKLPLTTGKPMAELVLSDGTKIRPSFADSSDPERPDPLQTALITEIRQWGGAQLGFAPRPPGRFLIMADFSSHPQFDPRWLSVLAGLPFLTDLSLCDTKLNDAGLEQLIGLSQVRGLLLSGNPISDDGLRHLIALPQLQRLSLSGTRVTDGGLVHLTDLPQ